MAPAARLRKGRTGLGKEHAIDSGEIWVDEGGSGGPTLLLLHGLGATAGVWSGITAIAGGRWPGRWVAPDLPGHGRSSPSAHYSFGGFAAAVAPLVGDGPVVAVGHSMGGVVALALASGWFGVDVRAAVALGVKVSWTDEDVAAVGDLARKPPRWFDNLDEASVRYLRSAGLDGLVAADAPEAAGGVLSDGERHRLAWDLRTAAVGPPLMRGLLAAAHGAVILARGEHDGMVTGEQLDALHPHVVELSGLGHNAQVEDPSAVWGLIERTHGLAVLEG